MFTRKITVAVAALALMSGAALAQNAWVEVDDNVQVSAFNATADKVDDLDVYDAAGKKIGEVDEVIGTDKSTATALVVDFEDDSSYTTDDIVIPLDQFSWENGRLVLDADVAAVAAMEVWKD